MSERDQNNSIVHVQGPNGDAQYFEDYHTHNHSKGEGEVGMDLDRMQHNR